MSGCPGRLDNVSKVRQRRNLVGEMSMSLVSVKVDIVIQNCFEEIEALKSLAIICPIHLTFFDE